MNMQLTDLNARLTGCMLKGEELSVNGFAIDSRQIKPGQLFVAIRGPNFDGHDFVDDVETAGAAALLVEEVVDTILPQLIVPDTRIALGELGMAWRDAFAGPLAALTGSNGKTSTKEMLASILNVIAPTIATEGNLNNDFGVPLTLGRLDDSEFHYAVIEMGANHPGEIEYLVNLAKPFAALVTNAGAAHLEGFGDLDGVANAKGEIYQGIQEGGFAIINVDDDYSSLWHELATDVHILTFGINEIADFYTLEDAIEVNDNEGITRFMLKSIEGDAVIDLPRLGRHNVMNALAAAATASALGAEIEDIQDGLNAVPPVQGRLAVSEGLNGSRIIDDSYNANPSSVTAGIDVVTAMQGSAWLVFGDMSEIGDDIEDAHKAVGAYAREAGIERLLVCGEHAAVVAEGYGAGEVFADQLNIAKTLRAELQAGVNVLVKGSRASQMEQVLHYLALNDEEWQALLDDEAWLETVAEAKRPDVDEKADEEVVNDGKDEAGKAPSELGQEADKEVNQEANKAVDLAVAEDMSDGEKPAAGDNQEVKQ